PVLADLPAERVVRFKSPGAVMEALESALDCKPSLRISAKRKPGKPNTLKLTAGHRFYIDRDYALVDAPNELLGCRTVQISHRTARADSSLGIIAKTPIRLFVAFAPEAAKTTWLKPQPGWKLYKRAALKTTMGSFGKVMDIHYLDIPKGENILFAGKLGNYVPVAIKPLSNVPAQDAFTFLSDHSMKAPLGLCAELTEQKNRRLVHLVNYRNDGPIDNVEIELRLPHGLKAKSVTLSSPEREEDITVDFKCKVNVVEFTVPRVDIYEIATVKMQ
ncbi:MAG: hypothetical protein JXM70_15355, partial [Pirellulales bacterium]|nr:hypothetical protein [Pirellulales bacterium]